jgi:hypothetical protein
VCYSSVPLYSVIKCEPRASIVGQQDQHNHQSGSPIKVDLQHDLHWLIDSQPLMSATEEVGIFKPQDAGAKADQWATQINTYPAQPAYRLGKHFEDCVERLFESSSTHHISARNIVIQTPARTLGELDLIYQNSNAEVVHLELAIKFYLLSKGGTQLADFIGPAGHDRLDLKWDRLRQHQLPLSHTGLVLDYLQHQGIPLPTRQQLLLTGMLFYAYENWQSTMVEHIGLNPNHQRGWWLEHHELNQLQPTQDLNGNLDGDLDKSLGRGLGRGLEKGLERGLERGFVILPKWHWIGGPRHYGEPQPIDHTELVLRTTADHWPNMVLMYERAHAQQPFVFKSRGLILTTKKPPLVT